jgi:AcrR family transcriptional regulator
MDHDRAPTPAVNGRGYPKGDARRAAIVAVATDFFGRVGYRGATMLQIAAACQISRAGLLHHFPTKESLLEAVLSDRDRTDRERLARADTEADGDLTPLFDLVSLAEHNSTIPAIVNLFAVLSAEAGDPNHPAHDYFLRRYEAARTGLQRSLERVANRGLLVAGVDPGSLAIELVALMDGLQVQWLLAPTQIDMPAVLRQRIQAVLTVPLAAKAPTKQQPVSSAGPIH